MNKRKILALILSIVLTFTALSPTLSVGAEERAESGIITGVAGTDATWIFDYDTETLTFSGEKIEYYECDEIADKVKHIVFEEGVEGVGGTSTSSTFNNVETVTFSSQLDGYSKRIFGYSTKLLAIFVPESNKNYLSIDGNLYSKYNGEIRGLEQYAVGKPDKVFVVPEGIAIFYTNTFLGANNLEEVVLPKSSIQTYLPYSNENIKTVTIKSPDCNLYSKTTVEGIVIRSYSYSEVEQQCMEMGIDFEKLQPDQTESIEIVELPEKTEHVVGTPYDPYGLELNVKYVDGTTEQVHAGFEILDLDVNRIGKQTVKVEYGGAVTTMEIQVIDIPESITLTVDSPIWTNVTDEARYTERPYDMYRDFYFTPKVTGIYRLYSTGGQDPDGYLMEPNGNILATNTDIGYESNGKYNNNFSIEYEMEEGKTYVLRVELDMADELDKFFLCVSLVETTADCNHTYEEVENIIKPTCSSAGYTSYKCTKCSETKKTDYTDMVEHEFTESVYAKESTCAEIGYTIYKCKNCNKSIARDAKDVLGHDYTDTVIEPTATEYGYTLHECGRCNVSFKTNWTDPLVEDTTSGNEQETTTSEEQKETNQQKEETTTPQQKVEDKTTVAKKLAKPKVKAKRSGKKIKLTLRSKNKNVKFQIFVKKNGKYKKIKTTKKKKYTFKHAKKCRIKVRAIKYNGKNRIYSKFRKVKI